MVEQVCVDGMVKAPHFESENYMQSLLASGPKSPTF